MGAHQLDLFPAPPPPLGGVTVRLPDCCRCGSDLATIGAGAGNHAASLRCRACERHRGWLSQKTYRFLVSVVTKFGFPREPIAVRRGDQQFPSAPGAADGNQASAPRRIPHGPIRL